MLFKNIILVVLAAIGFYLASLVDYPSDPPRPYLFVFGILIVVNIHLQYFLGLPMGVTYTVAGTHEYGKRKAVLVTSWLIFAILIFGALMSF